LHCRVNFSLPSVFLRKCDTMSHHGGKRAVIVSLGVASSGLAMGYIIYRACNTLGLRRTQQLLQPVKTVLFNRSIMSRSDTRIHLISSSSEAETFERAFPSLKGPLIGLDCEWVGQNKVALLQIADSQGTCLLLRLNLIGSVPDFIVNMLVNPKIIKVGVNIQEDAGKLHREFGVSTAGWVDMRHLAKKFRPDQRKLGLAGIAQAFLDVKLDKDWRVSASDWEAETLTKKQINYAADDAFVGVASVVAMAVEHLSSQPSVFKPDNHYDKVVEAAAALCKPYVGLRFSNGNKNPSTTKKDTKKRGSSCGLAGPTSSSILDKPSKRELHSVRKSPLYTNAYLEAPDGQQLCVTDNKHADWYVQKGLAKYVCRDPVTVRLNFEPKGRPEGAAGEYYLIVKSNHCVVCGRDESYLRKWIVPHEYRKHFPEIMRDHQSHDVLLFCPECHKRANLFDLRLRTELATICDAPIGTEEDVKVTLDVDLKKVRSAGRALLNGGDKIPQARRIELCKVLQDYYGVDQVTQEVMTKGANLESVILNENYVPHGLKVVQHFMREDGLLALEVKWRNHFLETMKPQHLPPHWSVDHQKQRLDIKANEARIDLKDYAKAVGQKNVKHSDYLQNGQNGGT